MVGWQRPGTAPLDHRARCAGRPSSCSTARPCARPSPELRPSAIYHLAGSAHVADSWQHTRETFEGNVLATHHLLQALHRTGQAPRVLVSGSATVYGPSSDPLTEDSALAPASPYATSKLAQEMVAAQAWREQGIPVLLARSFNHVGPRQTPAVRRAQHRAADCRDRAGRAAAGAEDGQSRSRARRDGRARHGARLPRDDGERRAGRALQRLRRPRDPHRRPGRSVPLARARAGRASNWIRRGCGRATCRGCGAATIGSRAPPRGRPPIPLEQTVDDLLAWWRTQR